MTVEKVVAVVNAVLFSSASLLWLCWLLWQWRCSDLMIDTDDWNDSKKHFVTAPVDYQNEDDDNVQSEHDDVGICD